MPEEKDDNRGRNQDRRKVAGGQDYEVEYEKEKTGASKKENRGSDRQSREWTQ